MKKLNYSDSNFQQKLEQLLAWEAGSNEEVENTVKEILNNVQSKGDSAVVEYTNRFDRLTATGMSELVIPQQRLQQALDDLPSEQRTALESAAERVRLYHNHQKSESWSYTEADGTMLGQQVTALDRVGLYVPGGKAAYPSSVLMNAIPAKVAGVKELIMVVPTPDGVVNELVLAAAAITEIDKVYTIGGAQAVAALAYGTDTVEQVDKIVGPGNIYVATAKGMVFGAVGIDMIAGPSEILVVCDGESDPDWIAMDLFSQAEHDEDAQSILISPDSDFLVAVEQSIDKLLDGMERSEIIRTALNERGGMIKVDSIEQALDVTNFIAPEHLELSVADPEELLPKIKHAGAIFMGRYTAEALGDYCAGPNHVLPTSRTANLKIRYPFRPSGN
jgi:histidinol dehydrogenase